MNCKTNITKRGTIDHKPNKLQHSPLSPSDKPTSRSRVAHSITFQKHRSRGAP